MGRLVVGLSRNIGTLGGIGYCGGCLGFCNGRVIIGLFSIRQHDCLMISINYYHSILT